MPPAQHTMETQDTPTRGHWENGRVVDEIARPWRPGRFVLLVLAALVIVDLAIGLVLRTSATATDPALDGADDVRSVLERATDEVEPWLLLGDSVLAGDVMAGRVDGWRNERVIDHMRRALGPERRATFHQVALNGLLPVDMLRIVTELDRIDPGARVSVVIELNPRFASRHYAEVDECTRDWLCELGTPLFDDDGVDWQAALLLSGRAVKTWMFEHLPVLRHRAALRVPDDLAPSGFDRTESDARRPDALEGRARLMEHYRSPASEASTQMRALAEIVARLRAAGRRGVFFTTPVEDGFHAAATEGADRGELVARWSRLIDSVRSPTTSLVNLDHPLFAAPLFLDHCHMTPEGNRRLALNLLHELGLPLAAVPLRTEIVRPEGTDATLVAHIAPGNSDGAGWQAAFSRPDGVAVQRGGRRVVVADTNNHCLRELSGNLQTVRTIAGVPGKRGDIDGPRARARVQGPRAPEFLGDDVWFTTSKGRSLRRLRDGHVSSASGFTGPNWTKIERIRAAEGALYLQDDGHKILRFDPKQRHVEVVVDAGGRGRIRAFDVASDGRLFIVDRDNNIWQTTTSRSTRLDDREEGVDLVFANTAPTPLPESIGAFFPFAFEEVRLQDVVDVRWVERYDGLLVQDDAPLAAKKDRTYVTERIHLRFFSLTDRLVYPWLKPLPFGGAHIVQNLVTDSFVTPWHEGSMALDQETASLFYLEYRRSRLVQIGDGMWGTARTGNVPTRRIFNATREFFGTASGEMALARLRPDRHLHRRIERLPRSGPYVGALFGSSMIGASDNVGMYSLARLIELHLQEALGYRDGIRFELIVRSDAGATMADLADGVEAFVESGARPAFVMVEVRATRSHFLGTPRPEDVLEQVERIRAATERVGAELIFLDLTAMVGRKRDALRMGSADEIPKVQVIRDAGLTVVEAGDAMLEDHLLVVPWASPPFDNHHASPWGIDATAERYAAALYPYVRAHALATPSVQDHETEDVVAVSDPLGPVFEEADVTWDDVLVPVDAGAIQRRYSRGHLELFVDLSGVDAEDEAQLERIALSCIRTAVQRDPASAVARRVTVRLARFSSYDEYGQGVLRGAEIRFERSLDADGLRELVEHVRATSP